MFLRVCYYWSGTKHLPVRLLTGIVSFKLTQSRFFPPVGGQAYTPLFPDKMRRRAGRMTLRVNFRATPYKGCKIFESNQTGHSVNGFVDLVHGIVDMGTHSDAGFIAAKHGAADIMFVI